MNSLFLPKKPLFDTIEVMRKSGFTVIEVLVVIAIIGVLSSYVLASLNNARENAQIATAQAQLKEFHRAIAEMSGDTGEWPGHQAVDTVDSGAGGNEIWDLGSQVAGLVQTDGLYPAWNGPYIATSTVDPWGNAYFFDTDYDIGTGTTQWAAVIGSFGPNGAGQNVYDADNVIEILSVE